MFINDCIVRGKYKMSHISILKPCRVGLVVSVSASPTVGREFASRPGHTKDHHQNGTDCPPPPVWHAIQ